MRLFEIEYGEPTGLTITGLPAGAKIVKIAECDEVEMKEEMMEDILEAHIEMLDPDLCVIGRQITTDTGRLDLLAIDKHGNTVIVEMKSGMTARHTTAQILDYGRWVENLDYEDLNDIVKKKHLGSHADLRSQLKSKFGAAPETWNEHHKMYIVAFEFDEKTIETVDYLLRRGVDINCVIFSEFINNKGNHLLNISFISEPQEYTG